ncbi:MAG: hypothetical protein JWM64_2695 [Frankiales bacterium]|nr:hypothetical protein [Frankiales bacterium]
MPRTSLGRRLAVGGLAAATAASGLALAASSASAAGPAVRLVVSNPQSVAAGSCAVYAVRLFAQDASAASDTRTVTVTLTEAPASSATQDVDFCTTTSTDTRGATTPSLGGARYTNADTGFAPFAFGSSTQTYTPGPSITPNPNRAASGGTPDTAGNADPVQAMGNTNNPSGVDTATFTPVNGVVQFGVVGLTAGAATLSAFVDGAGGTAGAADPGEISGSSSVSFTSGGLPGGVAVGDAAKVLDAEPETGTAQQGTDQTFRAVVTNPSGDTLAGVVPQLRVTAGANVAGVDQQRTDCAETDNDGVALCTFRGAKTGTDALTVFVQQTAGGTANADATEPKDDITRTTTLAAVDAPQARFLDLSPATTFTVAGQSRSFVVTVTSATGAPVRNVSVVANEDGPGRFVNGTSSTTLSTDLNGTATATVTTVAGETGTQVVTATVFDAASTQCTQAAGAGTGAMATTPAGTCSDSSSNLVGPAPSPSPSASPSVSPSSSSSPSPRPSPSATATVPVTAPPSSSPTPGTTAPVVRLERSTITSQESVGVSATTFPGAVVELLAYSRPSTTYTVVRRGVATQSGTISFLVGPSGNTRLFVRTRQADGTGSQDSASVVLTVRTSINLKVTRTGTRTYRFTGSTLPKRVNQLVTVFYQAPGGNRVIAARARVSSTGTYNVSRTFTGGGTFTLFTATGTDINNAGNNSNSVRTAIR